MVNAWLADVLPPPDEVALPRRVARSGRRHDAASELVTQRRPRRCSRSTCCTSCTLDGDAAMGELDDRILRHVIATDAAAPDAALTRSGTRTRLPAPLKSVLRARAAACATCARCCCGRARSRRPTSRCSGEAERAQDATQTIERGRVDDVSATALDALRARRSHAAADAPRRSTARSTTPSTLFERAARFGLAAGRLGLRLYAVAARRLRATCSRACRSVDRALGRPARALRRRGSPPTTQLPADDHAPRRVRRARQLDAARRGVPIAPRPATPAAYRAATCPPRRDAFAAKRAAAAGAARATTEPELATLLAAVQAVAAAHRLDFDLAPFTVDDEVAAMAAFVTELVRRRRRARGRGRAAPGRGRRAPRRARRRRRSPSRACTRSQAAGTRAARRGRDARPGVRPRRRAGRRARKRARRRGGIAAFTCDHRAVDFPVDDWLHGVARVREQLHAWEQADVLAAAFGAGEPELTPLQLPLPRRRALARAGVHPATAARRRAAALHRPLRGSAFDPTGSDVRPAARRVDRGGPRARGDDRPRRSTSTGRAASRRRRWLLVTPARPGGGWRWDDLVGALDETLELARLRAVEPAHVDTTPYARFLPATTSAVTLHGISIAANLAAVNNVLRASEATMADATPSTTSRPRSASATSRRSRCGTARGPAAHRGLRPRAAGRGARRAVDADAPVAARRVPRRGRGLARCSRKVHVATHAAHALPARRRRRPLPSTTTVPLEAQVERQPSRRLSPARQVALDLRLVLGRRWLKLIDRHRRLRRACSSRATGSSRPIPHDRRRRGGLRPSRGLAGVRRRRRPGDGRRALYEYLTAAAGRHAYDGIAVLDRHKPALDDAADAFVAWSSGSSRAPPAARSLAAGPARVPVRVLGAVGGRREGVRRRGVPRPARSTGTASTSTRRRTRSTTARPARPIRAPRSRAPCSRAAHLFAACRTRAGGRSRTAGRTSATSRPDTTDLAKLLFIEFGLVYSNDWFIVPLTLPGGSRRRGARARGHDRLRRAHLDRGGRHGATTTGSAGACSRVDVRGHGAPADPALLLLPTVPKVQEGEPLEEVVLIRDEMANMVWAIERTMPLRRTARQARRARPAARRARTSSGSSAPRAAAARPLHENDARSATT